MLQADQVEELVQIVNALSLSTLLVQFNAYRASFPIDFTPEYLAKQSTEQLRHLFLAMCLQTQKMPELPTAA